MLGGALCKQAPELNTAAGYGTSPYMLYSGWDGNGDRGDRLAPGVYFLSLVSGSTSARQKLVYLGR